MNENESYLFNVEQPTDWHRPPDHFWINGWFVAKNGVHYTDVRAFIDDVPFTGFFGLPRADIEDAYPQWTRGRHPGFAFRLEPWAGAKLIRLEILNEHGEWAEFWRVSIEISGAGECTKPRPKLDPELLELLLLRLLKQGTLNPRFDPERYTRRLVLEHSVIRVEANPVPPLRGQFENPLRIAHTQYDKLHIRGWVIHDTLRVRRVLATTDGHSFNALTYGLPRDDVPHKHPSSPDAADPGFKGIIDLSVHAPDPVPLLVFVELENGALELAFCKRLYQWSCLEKEHRLVPYVRDHYVSIVKRLVHTCRGLGVSLGGLSFWRTVWRIHNMYRDESQDHLPWFGWQRHTPYEAFLAHSQIQPNLRANLVAAAQRLQTADGPVISLLVDCRPADAATLRRLAASLQHQIYGRWQAVWVFPGNPSAEAVAAVKALAASDPRHVFHVGTPGNNFALTMNDAVAGSTGGWLAFPEASGRLHETALLLIVEEILDQRVPEVVFTDEDQMSVDGHRSDPVLKSAWSPEALFGGHHPGQLLALSRDAFARSLGFQVEYDRILSPALALRLQTCVAPDRVHHIPHICYHALAPRARLEPGSPEIEQMGNAVSTALQRRSLPGTAFRPAFAHEAGLPVHQVYWNNDYLAQHRVTIVIPTRDRSDLLERCIEALILTVDWRYAELLIVDDFSRDEQTVRLLRSLVQRPDFRCRVIQPEVDPSLPFNYSRLMNAALPYVETPLILHLNNDVDALRPGWIEEMAGWFAIPEVGVVGARLLYPNDHINHAGIIVGPHHGLADVPLAGLAPGGDAPWTLHRVARNVTAVTGACLMTRTSLYREFDGFDEAQFGVTYNDVDYCMRLNAAGHRVVYTPQAELWHWGSASRGTTYWANEHIAFVAKYPDYRDAFWSPWLKPQPPTVALRTDRYPWTERLDKLHLVLVSHNLNFEGAPLFLLEYARHMIEVEGFRIDVLSAEDGPLRETYEELGVNVALIDRHPLHGARHQAEFDEQVKHMAHLVGQQLELGTVDAFVCNTIACWWGVHLSAALGKPSMLYVHESASIKRFFSTALHSNMHGVARAAFRQATRVCFLCQATRAYYEELNDYDNFRYVSSWIDLPRIVAFRDRHDRAEMRRRLGYAEDETIIANIGTVCERKGQHVFIRTIDFFMRHYAGNQKYRFVFVGGRAGEFQDTLLLDLKERGIDNVDIITETREVYDYFLAADMFVCTSFEESFPRVLLEAMAFEVPIVSTNVHGIPEMAIDKADAYLVEPGHAIKFARTMKTCLDKLRNGTSTTRMAYSKVFRAYDMARILPQHADAAREAVLDFDGNTNRTQPHRLSGHGDRFESSW